MTVEPYLMQPDVTLETPLMDRLAGAFETENVLYSHWKSNINLAQPEGGEIELDLLVARRCVLQAVEILSRLGFKAGVARWGEGTPGISHYYGYDEACQQLVHVHLFSIVLTGESFVKSHLLPLEGLLLQHVSYAGQLRVTAKPAELIIFILRSFIKYGSLPDLLIMRRKSESLRAELHWLLDGEGLDTSLSLLRAHLPVFEVPLFTQCVEVLDGDNSLMRRVALAREVRRRLKVYARHGFWARVMAYGRLLLVEMRRRAGKKRKNKALQGGGAVVAFVGAEATGKSTLVAETERWLGRAFALQTVHAGKPPATFVTWPVSFLLPLLRRTLSPLRTNRLEGHAQVSQNDSASGPKKDKGITSLVYAARAVILAWERRQLLVTARRAAANGDIVICDRYPSDTVGAMDSPRLREILDEQGIVPRIFNRLARLEQRLYEQISPPDVVLRLHGSVETAQRRNRERIKEGKESDAYVASRHLQIREWQKAGTKTVHDINTEQSLEETIRCVKKAIWESL